MPRLNRITLTIATILAFSGPLPAFAYGTSPDSSIAPLPDTTTGTCTLSPAAHLAAALGLPPAPPRC